MKELVLECTCARSIVLVMPSLVHIQINESFMEALKVFSMVKTVTVDSDCSFLKVSGRVVTGGEIRKVDVSGGK